jgi:hypothetical protein
MKSCTAVDTLTLMSYFAGDLDEITTLQVKKHVDQCPECKSALAKLNQEQTQFLERYPIPPIANETLPKKRITIFNSRPLMALAATLVLVVTAGYITMNRTGKDEFRIKGDTNIDMYVQSSNGSPENRKTGLFCPGEKIQFTYSCGAYNNFVLLSSDTSGNISVYFPSSGITSIPLEPGQKLPLPNSIILDNYIGKEVYIALFSKSSINVSSITAKVKESITNGAGFDNLKISFANTIIQTVYITKRECR